MKNLVIAAALLSLLGGSAAVAQPDRDHDRREDRRDDRQIHREVRRDENRFIYGVHDYARFRGPVYAFPRGYAYQPWARGQYLPRAYFAQPYYINNWSYYRLGPPPYGYRYIRVGNDILLVAIGSGLISSVIAGVFY